MQYNLELDKAIAQIKKNKAKTVCIQLPDGLKPEAKNIADTIEKQTKDYIIVRQGRDKTSDVAKLFRKKFGGHLDDIIRMLPSGGLSIKKV